MGGIWKYFDFSPTARISFPEMTLGAVRRVETISALDIGQGDDRHADRAADEDAARRGVAVSAIRHVALVGCGFTGTSAFFQLVDGYPVREITIFEKSGRFGPGYPYRPDECRDYLVNNTTDTMCLIPSNRRAFVEWLKMRGGSTVRLDEQGHVSRALFGDFL